jgi:predicted amidophosphoribosyltransferase
VNAIIVLSRVRCSACNELFDFISNGSKRMVCPHCKETYLLVRGEWQNAKLVKPRAKPAMALYTYNWAGGGYNQCTARTKTEARRLAAAFGKTCGLTPDLSSFKRLATEAEQAAYYRRNFLD